MAAGRRSLLPRALARGVYYGLAHRSLISRAVAVKRRYVGWTVGGDPFRTLATGPKRRLRGQRRYIRGVQRRAASFNVDLRPDAWWDLWHYHADWDGWGNRGWSLRCAHLRALATVFQT